MNRSPRIPILFLVGMMAVVATKSAHGQTMKAAAQPAPDADGVPAISGILPPGATVGKTTEWTISGTNLARVSQWRISGDGVKVIGSESTATGTKLKVEVDPNAQTGYREVRAVGPTGISNLGVIRVDRLDQIAEIEPNDSPEQASPMVVGSAAWGVLKAQDLDYFRVTAKAGTRLTIELEAQRIGTPIVPVLSLMTSQGTALAQARETPGTDHDARLSFSVPTDGDYLIQARDELYAGGDSAGYRLRVEETPFAAGMFPLGGSPGATLEVTISGGSLSTPRTKTVTLPSQPGTLVDPGIFDGPDGPVLAPMKLVVGDSQEVFETAAPDSTGQSITLGRTCHGRISVPGEVDRYTVAAKKGSPIAVRIRAVEMGSWLDSVVTVREASGNILIENDDPISDTTQRNGFALNQAAINPDSRLVIEPKEDGPLTIEVADRYGEGGPAYGYRLDVGPVRPDFGISLLFANPAVNQAVNNARGPRRATSPGSNGVLNVKPGQSIPINFLITTEGKTGPIEIRAEGLPPGVTVQPKTVKPTSIVNRRASGQANADSLVLKVASDAETSLGELRIIAVAKPENGPEIVRTAASAIAIDTPLAGNAPPRPVMRTLTSLPLQVIGVSKLSTAEIRSAEASAGSSELAFRGVTVQGVLLQGGRLDLGLDLQPSVRASKEAIVEAKVVDMGSGLTVQSLLNEAGASSEEPVGIVRVLAAVDAKPGVHSVSIRAKFKDGQTIEHTASVIVRPPISVNVRAGTVELIKGKRTNLWVGVVREEGFDGPVEFKLELPKGVRMTGRAMIPDGETGVNLSLIALDDLRGAFSVRVTGVARMPRGPVRVDSAIRPMIVSRTAENGE